MRDGSGKHKCQTCDGVFTPQEDFAKAASGLGMPPSPISQGAENAVSNANGPQQPVPYGQFNQPTPPANQTTTKPRQMPGGGGGAVPPGGSQPGDGADVGFDPASNGSDVGLNAQPSAVGPPKQATRHVAYVLTDVLAEVLENNPDLPERTAYLLAKRVVDEYPMVVTATGLGDSINYGSWGRQPNGPLSQMLYDKTREKATQHWNNFMQGRQPAPVPAESPSVRQKTVQPEHSQLVVPEQRRTREPVSLPSNQPPDILGDDDEEPTTPTRTKAPWEDALDSALDEPKAKWGDQPSRVRGPV